MPNIPLPNLSHLSEAIERVGLIYIDGWDESERPYFTVGRRRLNEHESWARARRAIHLTECLVRDGRLKAVAYDDAGHRFHYFEQSREQIRSLLISPDDAAPGLIEMQSGDTLACEIDMSSLKVPTAARRKAGRKPKFGRFAELIEQGLVEYGPVATNAELKNFARKRIGDDLYPESKSTQNDIIDRIRYRTTNIFIMNPNPAGVL